MDPGNEGINDREDGYYQNEGEDLPDQDDAHGGQLNNQEYEINFDEVNEDDDIELLYAKLRASKKARQRADEDAKLLENRIKLLRQEEEKARKKINETKKRAKDIITTKKRNTEKQKQKKDFMKRNEQEENKRAIQNENMRNEIKKRINNTQLDISNRRRQDAEMLRIEKKDQEEMIEMYKQQEQLK
jgi:hypothetical protein